MMKGVRKPAALNEEIKTFMVENNNAERGNKKIEMKIKGLGIPAIKLTPLGLPSVDEKVLEELAGRPAEGKFGIAYNHFNSIGKGDFGKKLCFGISKLIEFRNIETIVKSFISPLRSFAD
eukprot:GHVR01113558.1.p1 GENE.GHVR01113558.1~~GHVR01113558.1.p1  ORF type:complete len:120 (-),score=21.00 GHVR01113558.1:1819-2178(-)